METHWGELAVRDAHIHFFSHRFISAVAALSSHTEEEVIASLGWEAPEADPTRFAVHWLRELDRVKIDSAVIIASVPGDEESVAAAAAAFPDRLYPWALFDPTADDAPGRAAAAMERGIRGLCLFPAMHRYPIGDERVLAVLQTVSQHPGAVVFVHCGVLTVGFRRKLGIPSRFDLRYSNPVDLHPVALDFPQIPFVIPHFGAGYLREALMVADLCPNVYLDTSSSNHWIRYHAPEPSMREVFRRALDVAGPKRLLFGTDSSFFPRGWVQSVFEDQSKVLYELAVPEADVAAILGGNLARLMAR